MLNGGIEAAYGHAPINEAGSQTFSSPDARGRACRRQQAKVAETLPPDSLVWNLPAVDQLTKRGTTSLSCLKNGSALRASGDQNIDIWISVP